MHPCLVQIRGVNEELMNRVTSLASKFKVELDWLRNGVDIYFEDVNDARKFISTLKKFSKFDLKMSTKYAGLRRGRVRVLFVYSLRCRG